MSTFAITCPQCGATWEAEEKYIGARAACAECDFHFILQKIDEEVVPVIELQPAKSSGAETGEEHKNQYTSSIEFKEFSFVNPPSKLTFAKPIALVVPSAIIEVSSWNDILCICFNYALTHENAAVLREFLNKGNNLFSKRIILSSSAANLRRAKELSKGVFLETNLSASHIIQIVCGLMKNCGFPAEQFFIRYIPQETDVSDLKKEEYNIDNQPETKASELTTEKIVATSPIEVFQFYPNVLQALKNQNIFLVKDLLIISWSKFSSEHNIGFNKVEAMQTLVNSIKPYLSKSEIEEIPLQILPISSCLSSIGKKVSDEICPSCHEISKSKNIQMCLKEEEMLISLTNIDKTLTYTKPLRLFIGNNEYELSSWKDVLLNLVSYFMVAMPEKFNRLINVAFSKFTKRICIQTSPDNLVRASKISESLWLEINFSAHHIVRLSQEITELCDYDLAAVQIVYSSQNDSVKKEITKETLHTAQLEDDNCGDIAKFVSKGKSIVSIHGDVEKKRKFCNKKTLMGTDSEFSVFSNFDFTFSVLQKLYANGFDFNIDARELQTIQWCQHNLNLRLPLLRKLRAFENADDYRESFMLLEDNSVWMICRLQDSLNRSGFLKWLQGNDIEEADVADMLDVRVIKTEDVIETADIQPPESKNVPMTDSDLLYEAITLLFKENLLARGIFSDLQTPYFCMQKFGLFKPVICRHYPYMREEEFGKDYRFWADGPQELPYLILHNCDGFNRTAFISFVQTNGLTLEDLADDLNCELSCISATIVPDTIPSEKSVVFDGQESQESLVFQSYISNDEIDRMLLEFVTSTPGQKKESVIKHLTEQDIPGACVESRLRKHSKIFCIVEQYYSADGIYGFEEAADIIWETLNDLFNQNNGYTSARELYRAVSGKLDDFFYDNDAFDSEVEIYQLAQYLFEKQQYKENTIVFLNKIHIWKERPDYPTDDSGLLIHWAKANNGLLTANIAYANFLRRGVADGRKAAAFSLAMDKVYDHFWMIDPGTFLLKDSIQLTESQLKEIKDALDNLSDAFDYDFIPMWDIAEDWFDSLPRIISGQNWTPMLLQSVLRDYSMQLQYKTIPRIEQRQQHAGIVAVNSEFKDYSDLVYHALKAEYQTPSIKIHRNELFDLLIKIGLWPEDVSPSYGNAFQNLFKDNFHFHVSDKNTLEVG